MKLPVSVSFPISSPENEGLDSTHWSGTIAPIYLQLQGSLIAFKSPWLDPLRGLAPPFPFPHFCLLRWHLILNFNPLQERVIFLWVSAMCAWGILVNKLLLAFLMLIYLLLQSLSEELRRTVKINFLRLHKLSVRLLQYNGCPKKKQRNKQGGHVKYVWHYITTG